MRKKNIRVGQIIDHTLLILLLCIMVYPLLMAVWCAFKSQAEFNLTKWYPTLPLNFENMQFAVEELYIYIFNTILVGVVGTLGMLIVSSLAAYAFSRMEFYLKNLLFGMVIGLMMVPAIMTLVPSFMLYKKMVGTDTYIILILPIITGGSVFGVFLLRSFFEGINESIFEAARIDGAGDFMCYYRICLPLSIPILATLAIMQLSGTWNDYIWPMIAIPTDTTKLTIAAAIKKEFLSANTGSYPTLFSGYLVASIPLILLYVFSNRFYVEGLTNSAVKF
jgi:ABC-type glycerol-3-phosphate transport system permease component